MSTQPLSYASAVLQNCTPILPCPPSKAAKHWLKPSLVCCAQPPRPPRPPCLPIKEDTLSASDSSSSSSSRAVYIDQGSSMTSSLSPKEIMPLFKAADSSQEVLQIVCRLHSSFDAINTATALHKTATLMRPSSRQAVMQHPGMELLLGLAEAHACLFKDWAVGNALWTLAKMQQRPSVHLLSNLTAAVHRNIRASTSQQLANSIWGFATLGHDPGSDLLTACAQRAAEMLEDDRVVGFTSIPALEQQLCMVKPSSALLLSCERLSSRVFPTSCGRMQRWNAILDHTC